MNECIWQQNPSLKRSHYKQLQDTLSQDICNMLQSCFESDNQNNYSVTDVSEISLLWPEVTVILIKGSRYFQMIQPDHSTLHKIIICSSDGCLLHNLLEYMLEQINCLLQKVMAIMRVILNLKVKMHLGMESRTIQKNVSWIVTVCWKFSMWVMLLPYSHPPSHWRNIFITAK